VAAEPIASAPVYEGICRPLGRERELFVHLLVEHPDAVERDARYDAVLRISPDDVLSERTSPRHHARFSGFVNIPYDVTLSLFYSYSQGAGST